MEMSQRWDAPSYAGKGSHDDDSTENIPQLDGATDEAGKIICFCQSNSDMIVQTLVDLQSTTVVELEALVEV